MPDYREYIKSHITLKPGMKVAVDGGCGGVVAAPLMREMGLETVELYIEMDGRSPNHHPDPTVEENMRDLQAAVKQSGAQVGIAYDGDAGRIGAVDEHGRIKRVFFRVAPSVVIVRLDLPTHLTKNSTIAFTFRGVQRRAYLIVMARSR